MQNFEFSYILTDTLDKWIIEKIKTSSTIVHCSFFLEIHLKKTLCQLNDVVIIDDDLNKGIVEVLKKGKGKVYLVGDLKFYRLVFGSVGMFCSKIYCKISLDKLIKEIKDFDSVKKKNYFKYFKSNEYQYLNVLENILRNGKKRQDRTGVGTLSLFGQTMTFNISKRIPIITTKKVFYNTAIKELLFFISGETNTKILEKQKVNIWKGNTSTEFLKKQKLDYSEGDGGPFYGFQWRHYGAKYKGCNQVGGENKYKNKGIDQLANLIKELKENPESRRHILTAWNVSQLKEMVLPPCHCFTQFYVRSGKFLDCCLTQRSGDMFLGVPFNIASYSILTYILAHIVGLVPGKLIHHIGDAHIYSNHIKQVKTQLSRQPRPFPTLKITRKVTSVDDFKFEDFLVENYSPWPYIRGKMAV